MRNFNLPTVAILEADAEKKARKSVRVTEVFEEGRWTEQHSGDRLKICKSDAQVTSTWMISRKLHS